MTSGELADIRTRVQRAKEDADMALAAVAMMERNLRELVKQLHQVHAILQGQQK